MSPKVSALVDERDRLLAAVLLALGLVEVWVARLLTPGFPGNRGLQTVGVLLLAVAVVARRRSSMTTVIALTAATSIEWAYARGHSQLPAEAFLLALVVPFSVAAHARRRLALLWLVLPVAAWIGQDAIDAAHGLSSVRTDFGFYLLCALAVAAGLVTGELNARGRRLQTLAAQLRVEREERARTAVLEERAHIARELHDVVAHSISVMVVQVGGARRIMELEPNTAREALVSAEHTGRQALAELRRLLGVLRSVARDSALSPQPGLGQLDQLVAQMQQSGLSISVAMDGAQQALPPGVDLAAYRIVQEALTNTLKHSTGKHVSVQLCWKPERLGIVIADDGLDKQRNGDHRPGHGLIGMRERVALYGGTFSAGRNGHGFVVTADLPLADR